MCEHIRYFIEKDKSDAPGSGKFSLTGLLENVEMTKGGARNGRIGSSPPKKDWLFSFDPRAWKASQGVRIEA